MILADTDVLIDYLTGIQPVVERMQTWMAQEQLATTVITCFELLSGARELNAAIAPGGYRCLDRPCIGPALRRPRRTRSPATEKRVCLLEWPTASSLALL